MRIAACCDEILKQKGCYSKEFRCPISSSRFHKLVHRHLHSYISQMMTMISRLQIERNLLLLKLLFLYEISYFCNF